MNTTFTESDEKLMRRCAQEEYENPERPWAGPDYDAAINSYIQRGGTDGEVGDLQQLFREVCETLGIEY